MSICRLCLDFTALFRLITACEMRQLSAADNSKRPCAFCAYATGQADRVLIYEDDRVVAFQSKAPAASLHYLVIPRVHIGTVRDLRSGDIELLKHMENVGLRVLGGDNKAQLFGFHVPPFNSVDHLHLHCFAMPFLGFFKHIKYLPKTPWFCTMKDLIRKLERQAKRDSNHSPV